MNKLQKLQTLMDWLKEFNLPISPILEYSIKEKMEQFNETSQSLVTQNSSIAATEEEKKINPSIFCHNTKRKATAIRVIKENGSFIECKNAAHTMSQTIKEIGGKKVYELKIPMDGMYLVTIGGNPLYPTAQHDIGNGFFVNVHSNTQTKKRQLEKIFTLLSLSWKVEII